MTKAQLIEKCLLLMDPNMDRDTEESARSYYANFDESYLEQEISKLSGVDDVVQAKENARRSQQLWLIFKETGLENTVANEGLLEAMMPGGTLSLELFVNLLKSNPKMRTRFSWVGQPLGKIVQAEQQLTAAESHKFATFQQACKHLAVSGHADIAPSLANYSLVSSQISEPVTAQSVVAALTNGSLQGLSGNAPGVVDAWREESLVQERQDLCRIIADNYTRDPFGRQAHYKQLLAARYKPIESLRAEVEEIKRRKALRNLNPEQLKEIIRSGQTPAPERKLPPIISAYEIKIADRKQLATWIEHYGVDALNRRLLGQDEV